MSNQSQIVAEFMAFLAIGFFLLVLSASFIGSQIKDISDDRDFSLIRDLGISIKAEIDIAANSISGYERNFTLAEDIEGIPYNITIAQNSLIVSTGNKELIFKIPNVQGSIKKGNNIIRNENGIANLN